MNNILLYNSNVTNKLLLVSIKQFYNKLHNITIIIFNVCKLEGHKILLWNDCFIYKNGSI